VVVAAEVVGAADVVPADVVPIVSVCVTVTDGFEGNEV
jgi:hypothetical protein